MNTKNKHNMSTYSYTYLKEYLPVRYSATIEQKLDRKIVYDFKDGICSLSVKRELVERIDLIRECSNETDWRICFIPASHRMTTIKRYKSLSEYLQKETGIPCNISSIQTLHDEVPGHLGGKKSNPEDNFRIEKKDIIDKNVILIDDVITRGTTFTNTANKLMDNGAKQVVGLFLAKTINPDWISRTA